MKPANQNEIDMLLRSLGRRDAGIVSAQAADEHLDSDELSAFAEGSVTERARARYSVHLSDCVSCRGIVVSLTQSTGFAPPRSATQDKAGPSFWRQLMAFSWQPALRFVVPAIVLVSIIGIGVIALRQDQPSEFVAQHDPSQQPTNSDQGNQAAPSQSPPTTESVITPAPTAPPAAFGTPPAVLRGESAGTIAGTGTSEGPAPVRKEAARPAEATPTFAPDVAAAAPPPAPAYAERDRAQPLSRQEAPKREVEVGQADEGQSPPSDSVSRNKAATAKAANNEPRQSNVQGLMRENRAYEDKDKNDGNDAKTVSGKRFIRRNNSWVDAAYQSMATTNVKRGSEQYRVLIADEPGLRAFAEQLSGQVIVVWKGRAYRFH